MKNIFAKIIILGFILTGVPALSRGAEMSFTASGSVFGVADEFLVEIYLDTEDESVNAVEGIVIYPEEILELKEIRDGNSSINFWVEKPARESPGIIVFSGMTPGGIVGEKKFLFSMVFEGKGMGQGEFLWSGVKVLKNDGAGTEAVVKTSALAFSVAGVGLLGSGEDISITDTDAPESFQPFIGHDPEIFEGKYFVVFSTVDKGSGVAGYAVREGRRGEYAEAESPYLLQDQSLSSAIFLKAYDKSGNERIVKIQAQNSNNMFTLAVVIGILLIVFLFWRKKLWRKSVQL